MRVSIQKFERTVRRSPIDDPVLKLWVILSKNTFDRRSDKLLSIKASGDDRNLHAKAPRPFRARRLELPNPGLKPWAEVWSPFSEETCTASPMLSRKAGRSHRLMSRSSSSVPVYQSLFPLRVCCRLRC